MITSTMLRRHLYCPRITYLEHVLKVKPERGFEEKVGLAKAAILKNVFLEIEDVFCDENRDKDVGEVVTGLILEKSRSLKEGRAFGDDVVLEALSCALMHVGDISAEYGAMLEELGFEKSRDYLAADIKGFKLSCPIMGLSAEVDKIMGPGFRAPVLIHGPRQGFEPDASYMVELCAQAILLERRFGTHIGHGYIEVSTCGHRKPVRFNQNLREKVFTTLKDVKLTVSGLAPPVCPHGVAKKCLKCDFEDKCYLI